MNKTNRAVLAFAVAPLVPTCLCFSYLGWLRPPNVHALWDLVVVIFWISAIFTYPASLVVGVPAYLLLSRRQSLRREHVLGIATVTGAVVGVIIGSPPLGALLGLCAGVTFWLIWHRAQDDRPF
jgi:hypothetical protein